MEVPDVTTHEPSSSESPSPVPATAQVDDAGDLRTRAAEEKATMRRLMDEDEETGMVVGASYYLVDIKWFNSWCARSLARSFRAWRAHRTLHTPWALSRAARPSSASSHHPSFPFVSLSFFVALSDL